VTTFVFSNLPLLFWGDLCYCFSNICICIWKCIKVNRFVRQTSVKMIFNFVFMKHCKPKWSLRDIICATLNTKFHQNQFGSFKGKTNVPGGTTSTLSDHVNFGFLKFDLSFRTLCVQEDKPQQPLSLDHVPVVDTVWYDSRHTLLSWRHIHLPISSTTPQTSVPNFRTLTVSTRAPNVWYGWFRVWVGALQIAKDKTRSLWLTG
jgi:hypothetical protein